MATFYTNEQIARQGGYLSGGRWIPVANTASPTAESNYNDAQRRMMGTPTPSESDSAQFGTPDAPVSIGGPGAPSQGAPSLGAPSQGAPSPYDPSQTLSGTIPGWQPSGGGGPNAAESDSAQFGIDPSGIYSGGALSSMSGGNTGGNTGGTMGRTYTPSNSGIWSPPVPNAGKSAGERAIEDFQRQLGRDQVPKTTPPVNPMPYSGGVGTPPYAQPTVTPASAMPTSMYDLYTGVLKDPSSATANPMYKNLMEQGLEAARRGMAARGFSGSGNMLTELQNRGMGLAAQYLPQMASMYQGGAATEAERWGTQNQGNVQSGQLGLNAWQAASNDQLNRTRANYGIGQDTYARGLAEQAQQQYGPLMQQMLLRGY